MAMGTSHILSAISNKIDFLMPVILIIFFFYIKYVVFVMFVEFFYTMQVSTSLVTLKHHDVRHANEWTNGSTPF
jgi:hypothetical protein